MLCTRVNVRGSPSRLIAVILRAARSRMSSGRSSGPSKPITVCPSRICSRGGGWTHSSTSAVSRTDAASTMLAPAWAYSSSGYQAASPAPVSMNTSTPRVAYPADDVRSEGNSPLTGSGLPENPHPRRRHCRPLRSCRHFGPICTVAATASRRWTADLARSVEPEIMDVTRSRARSAG